METGATVLSVLVFLTRITQISTNFLVLKITRIPTEVEKMLQPNIGHGFNRGVRIMNRQTKPRFQPW